MYHATQSGISKSCLGDFFSSAAPVEQFMLLFLAFITDLAFEIQSGKNVVLFKNGLEF